MILYMQTVNLTEARARLPAITEDVTRTHERYTVTRNGVPAVVVLSVDEYEGMVETLDILRDPRVLADLHQAEAEYSAGEGYSLDDLNRAMAERRAREDYDRQASV